MTMSTIIAGKLETSIGVISCSGNLSAIQPASGYIALSDSSFDLTVPLRLISTSPTIVPEDLLRDKVVPAGSLNLIRSQNRSATRQDLNCNPIGVSCIKSTTVPFFDLL